MKLPALISGLFVLACGNSAPPAGTTPTPPGNTDTTAGDPASGDGADGYGGDRPPTPGSEGDVDEDCVAACVQENQMRAVSAEQIEQDCRGGCTLSR